MCNGTDLICIDSAVVSRNCKCICKGWVFTGSWGAWRNCRSVTNVFAYSWSGGVWLDKETFDSRLFEQPVHPFYLSWGPGMVRSGDGRYCWRCRPC